MTPWLHTLPDSPRGDGRCKLLREMETSNMWCSKSRACTFVLLSNHSLVLPFQVLAGAHQAPPLFELTMSIQNSTQRVISKPKDFISEMKPKRHLRRAVEITGNIPHSTDTLSIYPRVRTRARVPDQPLMYKKVFKSL